MADFYLKDPGARLDYHLDWSSGLSGGAEIATGVWQIEPEEAGGLQVDGEAVSGGITTAYVAGGVPGHVYRLANRIVFSDGRTDERTVVIRVEDR